MQHVSLTVKAFAKINWDLRIVRKRDDGFHDLCTVFQTVSLADILTFKPSEELELTSDDADLPLGDENIVIRVAELLRKEFRVKNGALIHLEKNIPSPGGLGGGSSDAAATLLALSYLWNLDIQPTQLLEMASVLGSDVPFFLYGGTAFGYGRGTDLKPLDSVNESCLLVVTPNVAVSTKDAFADVDADCLTNAEANGILQICQKRAETLDFLQKTPENDFEKIVFKKFPVVENVKQSLMDLGAKFALLSGSGASVFAVFENNDIRQRAENDIRESTDCKVFAVATVSSEEFQEEYSFCKRLLPNSQ